MRDIRIIGLVAAALCTLTCAQAQTTVGAPVSGGSRSMLTFAELAATVAVRADSTKRYGADAVQFGDLRLPPSNAGTHTVIVLIHGGCWRSAYSLTHLAPAAAALAKEGYVVWVPEYHRVGESGGGWPGTFEDVAAAVDFVRVLARTVPTMDTTRVILVGHSAGGQLALWAASRANGAGAALAQPVPPIRVSGVVSLAGVTDMAAFGAQPGGCNSTIATLLGGSPSDVPERYRAVDPIQRLPIGVPVQLVVGASDPIVPAAQGEDYARRARSIGDNVTLTSVPGAGHFDVVAPQSIAWASVVRAVRAIAAP